MRVGADERWLSDAAFRRPLSPIPFRSLTARLSGLEPNLGAAPSVIRCGFKPVDATASANASLNGTGQGRGEISDAPTASPPRCQAIHRSTLSSAQRRGHVATGVVTDRADLIAKGRAAARSGSWPEAFDAFVAADASAPPSSIAGGTSEITRRQIGERILELPRDPLLR